MRGRGAVLFVVVVVFLSATSATCGARSMPKGSVTVTEKEDGRTLVLSRGNQLVVRLLTQLGTGYSWQVLPHDSTRLRLAAKPLVESNSPGRPGGSEQQVFRFEAVKAGTVSLELKYARPWEKETVPLKRVRLTIKVR